MEKEIVFNQLDDLLDRICIKLQLNETRKKRIEQSYKALCKFIDNSDGYFSKYRNKEFYAQGSYRIETTVKPKGRDEFDLDFILEINGDWKQEDPIKFLNELYKLFKESDVYKDKVEQKNRCVRINYENDFHIDILPGFSVSLNQNDTNLKVPDKELKDWTNSNPKGYAEWFKEKASLVNQVLLEKRFMASIEELPKGTPYELMKPLNKVVQLIKRYRDIYYKDMDSSGVRSIIITTLCADFYDGDASESSSVLKILNSITDKTSSGNKILEVYNPVNNKEKFSEKWDSDKKEYKEFCNFIVDLKNTWEQVLLGRDSVNISKKLEVMFGETVVKESLCEQAQYVEELRKQGKLNVSTIDGSLIFTNLTSDPNSKKVESHTFYGK